MSNRIRKTEHNSAKNGGGYWGKRADAKMLSKCIRRKDSRALSDCGVREHLETAEAGFEGASDEGTSDGKAFKG